MKFIKDYISFLNEGKSYGNPYPEISKILYNNAKGDIVIEIFQHLVKNYESKHGNDINIISIELEYWSTKYLKEEGDITDVSPIFLKNDDYRIIIAILPSLKGYQYYNISGVDNLNDIFNDNFLINIPIRYVVCEASNTSNPALYSGDIEDSNGVGNSEEFNSLGRLFFALLEYHKDGDKIRKIFDLGKNYTMFEKDTLEFDTKLINKNKNIWKDLDDILSKNLKFINNINDKNWKFFPNWFKDKYEHLKNSSDFGFFDN